MRLKHMAAGFRPDPLERSLMPLAAVAVVVELIIPSDSLVADRDVLQQRERERERDRLEAMSEE